MKSVVFQFRLPDVLTIRITGSNEGRFGRYCKRIDKAESEDGARVDYSSNVSGKWTIAGGTETELLREVRDVPVMYESVYQGNQKGRPILYMFYCICLTAARQ